MNLQWILKQSNQLNPKKKKNEEKDYDMKYNQPAYNHTIEKKEKKRTPQNNNQREWHSGIN